MLKWLCNIMNITLLTTEIQLNFFGNILGVLLSDLNRYLLLYESILSELDHFLDALDNLSNNQMSHSVVSADVMQGFDCTCTTGT